MEIASLVWLSKSCSSAVRKLWSDVVVDIVDVVDVVDVIVVVAVELTDSEWIPESTLSDPGDFGRSWISHKKMIRLIPYFQILFRHFSALEI